MKDTCKLVIMVFILVICILLTFLAGCKTKYIATEPQVVEVPKIEHHYNNTIRVDSIFQRDSVLIYQMGDTIYHNTVHNYYHETTIRDTVQNTDTITNVVKVPTPYPVEKELTKWQKVKMDVGAIAFGAILLALLVLVGCLVKKKIVH